MVPVLGRVWGGGGRAAQALVQVPERRGELIHRECKATAQVNGGRLVVEAQGQDSHGQRL